jgi:hypothetical protein
LVFQESKVLIIDYIKIRDGEATKNNVVDYMEGKDVQYPFPKKQEDFKTSRTTTYGILKDLKDEKRITVIEGTRNGQRHKLIYNYGNTFEVILDQIENIGLMYREHPEAKDRCLKLLTINLGRTVKYIKSEIDKQTLTEKIINTIFKIQYGEEDLLSKV